MSAPDPAEVVALQRALAAEHAAVFGYGAAGARLSGTEQEAARAAFDAHRRARDRLTERLRRAGAEPTPAPPGYALDPWPRSARPARALLVLLEEATVAAYAGLLGATDATEVRRLAVAALQAAAGRAARWRLAAGAPPPPPLPGLAEPGN